MLLEQPEELSPSRRKVTLAPSKVGSTPWAPLCITAEGFVTENPQLFQLLRQKCQRWEVCTKQRKTQKFKWWYRTQHRHWAVSAQQLCLHHRQAANSGATQIPRAHVPSTAQLQLCLSQTMTFFLVVCTRISDFTSQG